MKVEMPSRTELIPTMRADYSEYYTHHSDDSANSSREKLLETLIRSAEEVLSRQSRVRILDVGAGRQILERELQLHSNFDTIDQRIDIITIDIADLEQEQLLAPEFIHIQASGTELPIADNSIDIVISSSAADFMPREVYSEIYRVLRTDGKFLAVFHHESLITCAEFSLKPLIKKLKTAEQKVLHGKKSRKIEQRIQRRDRLLIELRDIQFIISTLPHLIFSSIEEIEDVLSSYGFAVSEAIEVNPSNGENGWYFADLEKSK